MFGTPCTFDNLARTHRIAQSLPWGMKFVLFIQHWSPWPIQCFITWLCSKLIEFFYKITDTGQTLVEWMPISKLNLISKRFILYSAAKKSLQNLKLFFSGSPSSATITVSPYSVATIEIENREMNQLLRCKCIYSVMFTLMVKTNHKKLPLLCIVPKVVFAHSSLSAALEKDFGRTGLVLSKRGASLEPKTVETAMYVRVHFDLIFVNNQSLTEDELSSFIWCRKDFITKINSVKSDYSTDTTVNDFTV